MMSFEEALKATLNQMAGYPITDENVKLYAHELLKVARAEMYDEIYNKAIANLPKWKPAAAAYLGDRLPRIDWSLKRLVARAEEGAFYINLDDLYKLPTEKINE